MRKKTFVNLILSKTFNLKAYNGFQIKRERVNKISKK
jgi:hypothetical protein